SSVGGSARVSLTASSRLGRARWDSSDSATARRAAIIRAAMRRDLMLVSDVGVVGKAPHAMAVLREYRKPWIRILDYLGLLPRGRRYRVDLRNGLRFIVRAGTGDLPILDEIFIHRLYSRGLTRLGNGDTVVDIGGHTGVFAVAAAARGARVFCYEPIPDNFDVLTSNIALNGMEHRIQTSRLAVGGLCGELELHVLEGDTGGAT